MRKMKKKMTDKQFEKELKLRLKNKSLNIYRHGRYDKVYELLLRYCHAKQVNISPLIWETMYKFLKSQMK